MFSDQSGPSTVYHSFDMNKCRIQMVSDQSGPSTVCHSFDMNECTIRMVSDQSGLCTISQFVHEQMHDSNLCDITVGIDFGLHVVWSIATA